MRFGSFDNEEDQGRHRGRHHHFGGRGSRHGRGGEHGGDDSGPFGFGGSGGPPFGGFPFPFNFFGRRERMKRGDVRAGILAVLSDGPRNGYQIMQELEQRSRGAWKPSPGSMYPALQQLEDEGLVSGEAGTGRTFKLTKAGERYVASHTDELKAPWEAVAAEAEGDARHALFGMFKHIAAAAMQVAHTGTPDQIAEAQRILDGTRRALYRLLAGDEPTPTSPQSSPKPSSKPPEESK